MGISGNCTLINKLKLSSKTDLKKSNGLEILYSKDVPESLLRIVCFVSNSKTS